MAHLSHSPAFVVYLNIFLITMMHFFIDWFLAYYVYFFVDGCAIAIALVLELRQHFLTPRFIIL